MLYAYKCDNCKKDFDVVKHHSKHREPENCPQCNNQARRLFGNMELNVDKMQPEYYTAFKEVVKSRRHREELIKRHGLVEVGNESPSKMTKYFEQQRAEKRRRSWEEV